MYTAVLMLAMTTSGETLDHGRRGGCHGCSGGYVACSGYRGGCSGYHGGYSSCCGGGYYRSGYSSGYYAPGYAYGSSYYYSPYIVTGLSPDVRQSFYFDPNQQPGAAVQTSSLFCAVENHNSVSSGNEKFGGITPTSRNA